MSVLPRPDELVEKIIVETRSRPWIAFSCGGCGILAYTLIGRHLREPMEDRRLASEFAHRVVFRINASSFAEQSLTPQILFDTATEVIKDPVYTSLLCTTWYYTQEGGVEVCSVGANSVLVVEEDSVQEVIIPHSVANGFLQQHGQPMSDPMKGRMVTHVLGGRNSCRVDEVRVARVSLLPTTTIAIIVDRRLADAILEQGVPRNELPSFIDTWKPRGKQIRTSVLISL